MNPIFDDVAADHPNLELPDTVPSVDSPTAMLPGVGTVEFSGHTDVVLTFEHPDGSAYQRVNPVEFASFDDVDSTTIVDDGAP